MSKMKPKMPAKKPSFKVGFLAATLARDLERYSNGSLVMGFYDCQGRIVEKKGKKEVLLGTVTPTFGCLIEVVVNGRSWHISAVDLFKAVQTADESYQESLKGEPHDS